MYYSSFLPFYLKTCFIVTLNKTNFVVSSFLQVFHVATILAQNYFDGKLAVKLSAVEASILSCIGLQLKDISSLEVSKFPTLIASSIVLLVCRFDIENMCIDFCTI